MENKTLVLVPTNEVKCYTLGRFIKNLKSIDLTGCDILFSDDTDRNNDYKKIIESLGYEVVKVDTTINALKAGKTVPISQALANTRNKLRDEFVARKQYDNAVWFDSDIIMPKFTIPRLLSHKKDLVTGVYFQVEKDGSNKLYPVVFKYMENEAFDVGINKYAAKFNIQELLPGRLIGWEGDDYLIAALGTGCMAMSREIMEDSRWRFRYNPKRLDTTEDMWFSLDIRDLGYLIHLDSAVMCCHNMKAWTPSQKMRKGGKK